jgi:hypothetical protein
MTYSSKGYTGTRTDTRDKTVHMMTHARSQAADRRPHNRTRNTPHGPLHYAGAAMSWTACLYVQCCAARRHQLVPRLSSAIPSLSFACRNILLRLAPRLALSETPGQASLAQTQHHPPTRAAGATGGCSAGPGGHGPSRIDPRGPASAAAPAASPLVAQAQICRRFAGLMTSLVRGRASSPEAPRRPRHTPGRSGTWTQPAFETAA